MKKKKYSPAAILLLLLGAAAAVWFFFFKKKKAVTAKPKLKGEVVIGTMDIPAPMGDENIDLFKNAPALPVESPGHKDDVAIDLHKDVAITPPILPDWMLPTENTSKFVNGPINIY